MEPLGIFRTGRRWPVLALAIAFVSLGFSGCKRVVACGLENTYCATSQLKNGYYAGEVRDPVSGQPVANRRLPIWFESRRDYRATINTDASAHYCIVWADEHSYPAVKLTPNLDANLHDDWRPLGGQPPPQGCQTSNATIPWDRAEDLGSAWQWKLLVAVPLLALALLLCGRLLRRRSMSKALDAAGAAAVVTSVILNSTLW
jgi:hypothetical protein